MAQCAPCVRFAIMAALLVAPPALGAGVVADEPAQLTPELAVDLRVCSSPRISPDGKHVLYRVRVPLEPEEEPGRPPFELRLVSMEGGASRLFVAASTDPSEPAWSPDGTQVAFLSKRRGDDEDEAGRRSRIFVMPADGGEARPVTAEGFDVLLFRWSPDGKRIAFVAADPETEERAEARKKGADWKVDQGELRDRRLRVLDPATGKSSAITGEGLSVWDADWSPDGSSLVAAVTDEPLTDADYLRRRLMVVPAGGGEPRLLAATEGKLEEPRWSPDGRHVAWLGATDLMDPSPGTVYVVPAGGGEPRPLLFDSPADYRHLAWKAPDQIAVSGEEGIEAVLDVLFLDGHLLSTPNLYRNTVVRDFTLSNDGTRVAFTADATDHPVEVFGGALGVRPRRLTDSNPGLRDLALGEQGLYEWIARDGTAVQGVLIRPVGFAEGRRYPLLVNPHGGPEFASLDGWVASSSSLGQMAAARGYLVLQPNYRGSTGRGEAFARADHLDLGGKEFDDVLDGIDALVEKGWADPDRVAIMGGSYGGYFTSWGVTRHSSRFAAAVSLFGISNWISFSGTTDIPEEMTLVHWGLPSYMDYFPLLWERSPLAHLAGARTPTLILHGEKDERVPVSQSVELYTAFRLRGVPTELVVYPREGHGFSERAHWLDAVNRSLDWLDRHLGDATD